MDIDRKREYVLLIIDEYMWELPEPKRVWNREVFEQECYSEWAVEQLHSYVVKHDDIDPVNAVTIFADTMDRLSMRPVVGRRYSIAYDTAISVLDLLLDLT